MLLARQRNRMNLRIVIGKKSEIEPELGMYGIGMISRYFGRVEF